MAPGSRLNQRKRRQPVWTPALDAFLRERRLANQTFAAIASEAFRSGLGHFSEDALRSRAKKLALGEAVPMAQLGAEQDGPLDCRDGAGADHLLLALRAAHWVPVADIRPSPSDGARLDWRRLAASHSGAGSAAALCLEA